jgi:phosphatidylglycerol:prolipoprotein diacylglycerol transferase
MLFAFAYGFARFLLEIVRDDAERGLYGPELGAHILLPGALALFAAGYSIGFANGIPNVTMRRLTQGLSFVPALVAFLAMRPGSFMTASIVQLSTSQWVGVLTAVAVSVAYMIYWKAAEAHPAEAMVINLKGFQADQAKLEAKKTGEEEEPEADEAEEEEEAPRKKAKKKKAKKAQEEVEAKFDDDEDEEEPSKKKEGVEADDDEEPAKPSKKKEEVEAKFDEEEEPSKDEKDDDEDEPSKRDDSKDDSKDEEDEGSSKKDEEK